MALELFKPFIYNKLDEKGFMKVSVIIPAHNAERSLPRCIDSALAQEPPPEEVIVVDDGSTDSTTGVIDCYGERVHAVRQSNMGQGAARNAGLERAVGDAVAFLDADDYWLPGFLARTTDFLDAHPDLVAVSTGGEIRHLARSRKVPRCLEDSGVDSSPHVLEDFFGFWAKHDHLRTGTVLMRKSVLDEAGGQRADLRISQDLEYWAYLGTFGPWGFIPEVLWVGDSRAAARQAGWLERYEQRRRLCPSVESWEARVLPRLAESDLAAFRTIRGRVAAGYCHSKILGGDPAGARAIVGSYGRDFPQCLMSRWLRTGHRLGPVGWRVACGIVRLRERLKARPKPESIT